MSRRRKHFHFAQVIVNINQDMRIGNMRLWWYTMKNFLAWEQTLFKNREIFEFGYSPIFALVCRNILEQQGITGKGTFYTPKKGSQTAQMIIKVGCDYVFGD